jgi:orotate phosphoribosyltransferase
LLQHPRHARALGETLGERLRNAGTDKIVAPALGGVIIGYTVAEALDLPFVFTERKDGQMTLRRGFTIGNNPIGEREKVVIVEDVVTTGKSTRETADVITRQGGQVIGFASILNRSGRDNPFEAPYESLLSLALDTYAEADCPLCRDGITVDAPGSRYSQAPR